MKLLMTADRVGGVWTYATDLARALAPLGVDVTIAVLGPVQENGAISDPVRPELVEGRASGMPAARASTSSAQTEVEVLDTDLPLDWLAGGPAPVRAAAEAIASLARDMRADLVHLNSPALAVARFPCPVVAVDHGTIAPWWQAVEGTPLPADFAWLAALIREGLRAADATVAPTAAYAAAVAQAYHLPAPPRPVHNGRTAPALPATATADAALTAGRLWDRAKRTDLLDRIAELTPIRAAGPVAGPHGDTVDPRHLHLLGSLAPDALAAAYAARPVFVSTASFEPFGLAVLEAAQAGCPLVLSDIASFRELWNGAALFVAGEEPRDWADAIERAQADRDRLGQAARARAARYTPAATAAAMHAIYAALLATRRAAA